MKIKILIFLSTLTFLILFAIIYVADLFLSEKKYKSIAEAKLEKRYIRLKEHSPNKNLRIKPDKNYLKYADGLEEKTVTFRSDNDGFIEPSQIYDNPDLKIFFIGGSTTENSYLDEDNRFPYLVGSLLKEKLNLKINSYNAGHSGNNTIHSINILLNKIIPYKPDIAILMHNINDLSTLLHTGTYWNKLPTRSPIVYPNIVNLKEEDVIFGNLIYQLKKLFGFSNKIDEFQKTRGKNKTHDIKSISKQFKNNIQLFIEICKIYKIKPILMTQANRISMDDKYLLQFMATEISYGLKQKEYIDIYNNFNNIVRDVAGKNGIELIDLDKMIPKNNKFMYDNVHFNNNGSKYASELIANYIYGMLK